MVLALRLWFSKGDFIYKMKFKTFIRKSQIKKGEFDVIKMFNRGNQATSYLVRKTEDAVLYVMKFYPPRRTDDNHNDALTDALNFTSFKRECTDHYRDYQTSFSKTEVPANYHMIDPENIMTAIDKNYAVSYGHYTMTNLSIFSEFKTWLTRDGTKTINDQSLNEDLINVCDEHDTENEYFYGMQGPRSRSDGFA